MFGDPEAKEAKKTVKAWEETGAQDSESPKHQKSVGSHVTRIAVQSLVQTEDESVSHDTSEDEAFGVFLFNKVPGAVDTRLSIEGCS